MRTVSVYHGRTGIETVRLGEDLTGGDVLPGFRLRWRRSSPSDQSFCRKRDASRYNVRMSQDIPSRDELATRYLDQLPFTPYPFQEEALWPGSRPSRGCWSARRPAWARR